VSYELFRARLTPDEGGGMAYIFWEEDGFWLGYLQEFPDYWTQGMSREDLEAHLRDLYTDLTSGQIPNVRRVAQLQMR
jgi:hypothetical protein